MLNLVKIINPSLDRKNKKAVKKIRSRSHHQINQLRTEIIVTFAKTEAILFVAITVHDRFILILVWKSIVKKIILFMKKCQLKMMIQNGIVQDANLQLKKEIKKIKKSFKD